MTGNNSLVNRRNFMKGAAAAGFTLGAAGNIWPQAGSNASSASRIIGANDKINVAAIGVGGRGSFDAGMRSS